MYITQATLHNFRKSITKAWGEPVTSQRACTALSAAILKKTGLRVASHTLRRFFGLVAFDGQFRKTTLDALAIYAGYDSSEEILDRFKDEEDLVELLVKLQVQDVDIDEYYINRLIERDVSMEVVMMAGHMILIRLEQGDYERVIRLFNTLRPLDTQKERYFAICYVFAHYVAPKFYTLEDEEFIRKLMKETVYLDLVLSFFVPFDEMHLGFGQQIRWMLELSEDGEHQAFGNSLLSTRALLEGDLDLAQAHFDGITPSETPYFSILQGRIDALEFFLKGMGVEEAKAQFTPPPNGEVFYFKAVIPLLVILNESETLEYIIDAFQIDSLQTNHWMEESVQKQTHLAKAWLLAKAGEKEASERMLAELETFTFPRDYQGASVRIIRATRELLKD